VRFNCPLEIGERLRLAAQQQRAVLALDLHASRRNGSGR
jgi:hypothetical protein